MAAKSTDWNRCFDFLGMVELLGLVFRLTGQVDPQLVINILIHAGKNHTGMGLTPAQLTQLLHGQCCSGVGSGAYGQCDKDLIGKQARIVVAKVIHL